MRTEIFSHSRHPFQIFVLALCLVTTFPTLIGIQPPPGTITAIVPHPVALVWAWALFLGAGAGLFSSFMKNRGTGIIVEQFGLAFAGLSCIFYAFVIGYYTYERGGLVSAGIVGGFGLSCLIRCGQIQRYLHRVNRVTKRLKRKRHVTPEEIREVGHGV